MLPPADVLACLLGAIMDAGHGNPSRAEKIGKFSARFLFPTGEEVCKTFPIPARNSHWIPAFAVLYPCPRLPHSTQQGDTRCSLSKSSHPTRSLRL